MYMDDIKLYAKKWKRNYNTGYKDIQTRYRDENWQKKKKKSNNNNNNYNNNNNNYNNTIDQNNRFENH